MAKQISKKKVTKMSGKKAIADTKVMQIDNIERVRISDESFQGKYCNLASIKHTEREFVFDFIWNVDSNSILSSRVITSPRHAKEIHEVLGKNLKRYEKQFGDIKTKRV